MEVAATGVPVLRLSSTQTAPNNILMTGGSSYNYGVIGVNTGNNTSTGDIFHLGYTASAGAAPTSILQWSNAAKCIGLNTTPATSGTGITFPATQNASSDANTLDDYEEGTFTPTIVGASTAGTATYANQIGKYTKIGDRVLINIYLQWSGGTGTGNMNISGLPFSSDGQIPLSSYNANIAMTAGHVMQVLTQGTLININSVPSGGGSDANVPYDASGLIIIGGSYKI
jgi:hypothetical protein